MEDMILNQYRIFYNFLLLLLLIFMTNSCASRTVLNGDLEFLLKDLEKKSFLVRQFKAEFHKVRQSPVFKHEMHVKGNLVFQKEEKYMLQLNGDINVEILSDGEFLTIIHDGRDQEFYHLTGHRDRSKFSDPLMSIVNTISGGDLGKFSGVNQIKTDNQFTLEIQPGQAPEFERIKDVSVDFSESGVIRKVVLNFKDGSKDTTVFDSWSMLTQDDPSIIKLNAKLEHIANNIPSGILPGSTRLESHVESYPKDNLDGNYKKPVLLNSISDQPVIPQQSME